MNGYVYILANSAIPTLIKIGRTTKDPKERASELSGTGTPGKFIVIYSVYVTDCVFLEKEMHDNFSAERHSNDREFFEIEPVSAIDKLILLSKPLLTDEKNDDYVDQENIKKIIYLQIYLARINKFTVRYGVSLNEDNKDYSLEICDRLSKYYSEIGAKAKINPEILKQELFEIYGDCKNNISDILEKNIKSFFEKDLSSFNERLISNLSLNC